VTPLRDGMNLVAKEFVAAQDGDDPGVLLLSPFAGAARELDGAGEPLGWHPPQRVADRLLERRRERDVGARRAEGQGIVREPLDHHLLRALGLERERAGHHPGLQLQRG